MGKPLTVEEVVNILNHLGAPHEIEFGIDIDNESSLPYKLQRIQKVKKKFLWWEHVETKSFNLGSGSTLTRVIQEAETYLYKYKIACDEADNVRSKYVDATFDAILKKADD